MDKKHSKEFSSDRSDNLASKSLFSRNIPDISHNSLLSSDVTKKTIDKNNEIKPLNLASERSINKNIKKSQLEEDSYSYESKYELSKNKKKEKKKSKQINDINTKIIVDDIQNIYSCIANKSNYLFLFQKILLLSIACLVNVCRWLFLFLNITKLERDYCLTNLNQFDSCSSYLICQNYETKVNIFLFNNTLNINDNSKNVHENFKEEFNSVNDYYKPFFINHNYLLSKNKIFSSNNLFNYDANRLNIAIILYKKEKWNIFYRFYSLCQKELYYFWASSIIVFSGAIGSIFFGFLADLYGRKKIICLNLFIVTLSFSLICSLTLITEYKYDYYLEQFEKNYSSNEGNNKILSILFAQQNISKHFEEDTIKYFIILFFLCLSLRPLEKISLALLLEDSTCELKVLESFRIYIFFTTGFPPFIVFLILIAVNDFIITIIMLNSFFFICFICSFFFINESIRWHYEFCEWKELTYIIKKLFTINEKDNSITYKNKMEFEAFRFEENKKIIENIKKMNIINKNKINSGISIFNFFSQRVISLKRDIRRNCEVIIKRREIQINPIITISCISSNRIFNKSKFLFLMLLMIIFCQVHFVEKELINSPFLQISDLYFGFKNNFIINSNYFILLITSFFSNIIYYLFYRINCFKIILFLSLIFVTIFFILYYYISDDSEDFPLNLNSVNFSMLEQYNKTRLKHNANILILMIYFLLNGIQFYINILILKISRTIYRCTLFGIISLLSLSAFSFGEALNYQIKNYFFLIGSLNIVGIVVTLFFGELKTLPYIINDLKQNPQRGKKNKNK